MGARAPGTGGPAGADPNTVRRGNAGGEETAVGRVAVLVAGMHRSGTSLLTQVLAGLGCDAPKTLMEADKYNDTGYWESTKVVELNDAMLKSAGSAWDDWEHLRTDWFASRAAQAFRRQAEVLLESEFADSRLFVLKDPRLCRLLPFWCDVAQRIGVEPRIAITLRNPLETAASLADRDAMPPSVGILLWLRNVLQVEMDSRPHQRAFARYDDTLANWRDVAERLSTDLGVVWPKPLETAAIELDQRVSPALRHQQADDALSDPALSRWTKSAFDILARWARGERGAQDTERLDAVRSEFDDACAIFRQPVIVSARLGKHNGVLEKEVQARGAVIAAREREMDSLNQAMRDRDDLIAAREQEMDSLNRAVRDRDDVIAAHEQEMDSLNRAVRDRDDAIDGLRKDIERQQKQLASLNKAVGDRDIRTDALIHAVSERDGLINAANENVRARDRQIGKMNKALIERDDRLGQMRSALVEHEAHANTLTNTLAERDEQIAALGQTIVEHEANLDQARSALAEHEARANTLDGQIAALGRTIVEHEAHANTLANTLAEKDSRIDVLHQALTDSAANAKELHQAIDALRSSTSWRVTKPLRWLRTKLGGEPSEGKFLEGESQKEKPRSPAFAATPSKRRYYAMRALWRLLPIGFARRTRWKARIVKALPAGAGRRLLSRAPSARAYIHCGRLDLADRNFEASRNNAPVPILFDPEYYLATNNDIRDVVLDPLAHYMEAGCLEGRLPIDIADEDIDPLIRDLHRCDLSDPDAFAFDPAFYRTLHADLSGLDDVALQAHYEKHGQAESRMCSKGEFLRTICSSPREIPIDFRADEYLNLYPDLQATFSNSPPLVALQHYMSAGRWEPRLHTLRADDNGETQRAPSAPIEASCEPQANSRVLCVLAHVYYPELWSELSGYLANLPPNCYDLHINLVDTTFTQELLSSVREDFPEARVFISENEGRDIGGHFRTLQNVHIADYRLFFLIHTKKSPHMSEGEVQLWRRKLLRPLLGTAKIASDNISRLLADESIGMLGAERCRYTELNDNPEKYFDLLECFGVKKEHHKVDFLSGTMMFLRREVLERVFVEAGAIEFEPGDEKSLTFHRDGQWAHAIERVLPAVARDMNYRVEWR